MISRGALVWLPGLARSEPRLVRPRQPRQSSSPHLHSGRGVLTIRQSILLAFVLMCVFTAIVGTYSATVIRQSSALVVDVFDRSLMSIDYARAAGADFAAMQTAFLRQRLMTDAAREAELQARSRDLSSTFYEDLGISAERSQSARARRAAEAVREAAQGWEHTAGTIDPHLPLSEVLFRLDGYSEVVEHDIDLLINLTAGDGFLFRQQALRSIRTEVAVDVAATLAGLLLTAAVTWFLNRRISGPVSAASDIAVRIARGDLEVAIPEGRRDELGSLLQSMATMRDSIKAMMQAEVSQRQSAQARLMDAVQTMQEGVVLADAAGQIVVTNAPVEAFFGTPPGDLPPSRSISDLLRNLARTRLTEESLLSAGALTWPLAPDTPGTIELGLLDGRWLRVSWCATVEGGLVAFFSDITLPRSREAQLTQTNIWFDAALTHMSQGLCVYDSRGGLKVFNARFCDIYQLARDQVGAGMKFDAVQAVLDELADPARRPEPTENAHASMPEWIAAHRVFTGHQFLADQRVIAISHRPMSDGGWVLTYEDVTARYRSDARIAHLARHDPLTGLPNRTLFSERLDDALNAVHDTGCFALLLIDLDRFKEINDSHGHPMGDRLLRVVAERLQGCARNRDTVARLGGDEFAMIQTCVPNEDSDGQSIQDKGAYDAEELAARVIASLGMPFTIDGTRLEIGASIGIALAPCHGNDQENLLRCADTALYRAKQEGRSSLRVYSPSMDNALRERRALEHDLLNAVLDEQMELFYQPIVDIDGPRITGFEALLRWHHPTRGLMMPGSFITLSEDTGFIERLGAWILQRACSDAAAWPSDIKIAVNVSPVQFRSGRLVERLREALAGAGMPARRIELEITESALLYNNEGTLDTLRQIHSLGAKIALDDFGTGFSSLSYLRSFPFDRIKIDRSFVSDLGEREDSSAIIRAILGLGRSLHIPVTAEGVETVEQLALLKAEGCTQAQGYLFSRPIQRGAAIALMKNGLSASR